MNPINAIKARWSKFLLTKTQPHAIAGRLAAYKKARAELFDIGAVFKCCRGTRDMLARRLDVLTRIEQTTLIALNTKPTKQECAEHNFAAFTASDEPLKTRRVCMACALVQFRREDMPELGWLFFEFNKEIAAQQAAKS
mgnify:FL=1